LTLTEHADRVWPRELYFGRRGALLVAEELLKMCQGTFKSPLVSSHLISSHPSSNDVISSELSGRQRVRREARSRNSVSRGCDESERSTHRSRCLVWGRLQWSQM